MFDTIIQLISEGKSIEIIITSIVIAFIFKINNVYLLFDNFSKRKLQIIRDFLGEKCLTDEMQKLAEETINTIAFQYMTGIRAEKYKREKIIKLYNRSQGRLSYSDFKHSRRFLSISPSGALEIRKITRIDYIDYYVNLVFSWIFWFLSFLSLIAYTMISGETNNFKIQLFPISSAVFFFVLALLFFVQTKPLFCAKKIKKEIDNIKKTYKEP